MRYTYLILRQTIDTNSLYGFISTQMNTNVTNSVYSTFVAFE